MTDFSAIADIARRIYGEENILETFCADILLWDDEKRISARAMKLKMKLPIKSKKKRIIRKWINKPKFFGSVCLGEPNAEHNK